MLYPSSIYNLEIDWVSHSIPFHSIPFHSIPFRAIHTIVIYLSIHPSIRTSSLTPTPTPTLSLTLTLTLHLQPISQSNQSICKLEYYLQSTPLDTPIDLLRFMFQLSSPFPLLLPSPSPPHTIFTHQEDS
ncbi:hypothetical protein EYC80_007608 [Monilinia laxa]|uniref:Uncharacterized protein n=1 Tax=Monilinia laxa TaxID=61186 RepID=A0A5N6JWG2_MONLA|nr:hypothetical protein EYC80_007608 [Monilinia laxa]